jgi:heme exporter protein C
MIPSWHDTTERLSALVASALIPLSLWIIFMKVPNEQVMGAVQRIFYFHVGSAIAAYAAVGISFIAGIKFLLFGNVSDDAMNEAAGEVGLLLCTIVLGSGMIWGHAAWNTWFRWEPRLVTFLLLWLIFVAFVLLRAFGEREVIGPQAAVLSIIGSATVPLVWISVKLLPQAAQLHPQVIENQGLRHPLFTVAFLVSTVAIMSFMVWLVLARARIGILERTLSSSRFTN